jgi:hypothetical protein
LAKVPISSGIKPVNPLLETVGKKESQKMLRRLQSVGFFVLANHV